MSDVKEELFGSIEISGKDIGIPAQKFDKIAITSRGELLLLSVVAEIHNIKRIRSILAGGAKVTIMAGGVSVSQPGDEYWRKRQPGRVSPTSEGYQVETHKLGFNLVQALFMTRMPGFMKVISPASLWMELKQTRFTTPIIQEWMPYIEERLRAQDLLEDAHCFGCRCGMLVAMTKHLDEIVSEGIQQANILVPGSCEPARVAELMSA